MNIHFESEKFLARPFDISFQNVEEQARAIYKSSLVIRRCAALETFFTDYIRGCNGECEGFCKDLSPKCGFAQQAVAAAIMKPDAISWEVWTKDESGNAIDFVGILRLEGISIGCDATAHYFFFDGKLRDKTELLKAWNDWIFGEHEGWLPLHRVTIKVPTYAFALARHAHKHLGFGGPYEYEFKQTKLAVEGVQKSAMKWRGDWHDMMILGKVRVE